MIASLEIETPKLEMDRRCRASRRRHLRRVFCNLLVLEVLCSIVIPRVRILKAFLGNQQQNNTSYEINENRSTKLHNKFCNESIFFSNCFRIIFLLSNVFMIQFSF